MRTTTKWLLLVILAIAWWGVVAVAEGMLRGTDPAGEAWVGTLDGEPETPSPARTETAPSQAAAVEGGETLCTTGDRLTVDLDRSATGTDPSSDRWLERVPGYWGL